MVNDIRLYIGNFLVEFDTVSEILYNWSETDFTNPLITKNSYSKTIVIPGTKQNNKIFGHFWDLERINGNHHAPLIAGQFFNPTKKTNFLILVNGNIFEEGYCKLQKVTRDGGIYKYEVGLFGGLGGFFYNISVNPDGSMKTFADLNFYNPGETQPANLDFVINKDTVLDAWNHVEDRIINFMPAYNGVPENFDSNKGILYVSGLPGDISPVVKDGVEYSPYTGKFSLCELPDKLDMWQTRDLRSYLQTPVLKVKNIIEALTHPENTEGEGDDRYQVILDTEFFNDNNPYFADAFITLNNINSLNFEEEFVKPIRIYQYDVDNFFQDTAGGRTEVTRIVFELDNAIDYSGYKAHITFNLLNYVVRKTSEFGDYPVELYMNDLHRIAAPGILYGVDHQNAICVQGVALNSEDTPIGGSAVQFYRSPAPKDTYVYYQGQLDHIIKFEDVLGKTYTPMFYTESNTTYNAKFKKLPGVYDTYKLVHGEPYTDAGMTLGFVIPQGTKKIVLDIQRCSHTETDIEEFPGNLLFKQFAEQYTGIYTGYYKYEAPNLNNYIVISKLTNNSNFYSGKKITQEQLLKTNYSVADWFISYCKMMGLYVHKDTVGNNIYVDTRNTYYKRNEVIDISGEIDYSKPMSVNPVYVQNKYYTMTNPQEKSETSKKYFDTNNYEYGCKVIDTGFDFNKDTNELFTNSKIKTAVPLNRQDLYNLYPIRGYKPYVFNGLKYYLYPMGDNTAEQKHEVILETLEFSKERKFNDYYDSFYKLDLSDGQKGVDPSGIMVFFNGMKDVLGLGYYITDDSNLMLSLNNNLCWWVTNQNQYDENIKRLETIPQFSTYLTDGQNILYSTNFGSPREFYVKKDELFNNDNATLYSQFYKAYYEDLLDDDTKVVDCYIKPRGMFTAESLRKIYWFDNSIWRLNKIEDYTPVDNRSVKCQFIKLQDVNSLTSQVPVVTPDTFYVLVDRRTYAAVEYQVESGRVISDNTWTYQGATARYENGRTETINMNVNPITAPSSSDFKFTVPQNDDINPRYIEMRFTSEGITKTVTLYQYSDEVFYWNKNNSSYLADYIQNTQTEYIAHYTTNITNINFECLDQNVIITLGNGYISITVPENYEKYKREFRINVYDRYYFKGQLVIKQFGRFWEWLWKENGQNSLDIDVPGEETNLQLEYTTNIPFEERRYWVAVASHTPESLVIQNDTVDIQLLPNTGTTDVAYVINFGTETPFGGTYAELIIHHKPAEAKWFKWDESEASGATVYVDANITSYTAYYTTNYDPSTIDGYSTTPGCDVRKAFDDRFNIFFPENTGIGLNGYYVTVTSGDKTIGSLTIYQRGLSSDFVWNDTGTSATTANVEHSATTVTKSFTTSLTGISFEESSDWITGVTYSATTVTVTFSENQSTTQRTGTVTARKSGEDVGVFTITQGGKPATKYINLQVNGSTAPGNIPYSATTIDISTNPNDSFIYSITAGGSSWKTNVSGVVSDTYTCGDNTGITERVITVNAISQDGTSSETVVIRQDAPPGNPYTFTIGSQTQPMIEVNNTPNVITYSITNVYLRFARAGSEYFDVTIGQVLTNETLTAYIEKDVTVYKQDVFNVPDNTYQVTLYYTIKLVNSEANTLSATTMMSEASDIPFVNGEATVSFAFVKSVTDTQKQIPITRLEFN